VQISVDDDERSTDLQHRGRIHDVLGGRAPMHIAAGFARGLRKLMDQRKDGIADDLRLVAERVVVDHDGAGRGVDGLGRLRWNDVEPRLRAGERRFRLKIAPYQGLVGEHRAHLGGAEHVPKEGRIENGAGQSALPVILLVHNRSEGHWRADCRQNPACAGARNIPPM
jgi:hypothetical protein